MEEIVIFGTQSQKRGWEEVKFGSRSKKRGWGGYSKGAKRLWVSQLRAGERERHHSCYLTPKPKKAALSN